ncbi:MAG: BamA/TamA family outer membrane protein [Bacteroidota bacterium]|nr:BamA/TamA family outer membrane protein [Bacteroidota bacterium]
MTEFFLKQVLSINIFILSCFLFFSISIGTGQENALRQVSPSMDSNRVVDSVMVVGNSLTKNFVILREMSLRSGKSITKELIEYDQNRIYSLGLFNQVTIHVQPTSDGKANLLVEVSERWYIFLFPVIGIKDRDWENIYYGGHAIHSNFRGRNEKLFAEFVFGYDPSLVLSYRNPFLKEDGSLIFDAKIGYNKVRNKSLPARATSEDFHEQHYSMFLNLGYRIEIKHTFWLSAGYKIVDIPEYDIGRTISPDGKDQFPIVGLTYLFDSRDLAEYPASGSFTKFAVFKSGIPADELDLIRYAIDLRRYQPLISNVTLTGRIFNEITAGSATPSHNRLYFGYGERIRGHFNEVFEGENIIGVSTELHYPLMSPIYYKINFLPAEFRILKFGIVAAAFADAGSVWFRRQPFALDQFKSGYGLGIHFLLPYSFVLRTDYAWNELRCGEFILDLGASF